MGLWHALLLVRDLGLPAISIKLDCLLVVNGVQGEPNRKSEFGTLISYSQHFLNHFQSFKVSYVRRQTNCVAHNFARVSRFHASSSVHNFISVYIETLICNEMIWASYR